MPVTKETIRAYMEEVLELQLTDEELDRILPAIQSRIESGKKIQDLIDLTMVPPAQVFRADPGR